MLAATHMHKHTRARAFLSLSLSLPPSLSLSHIHTHSHTLTVHVNGSGPGIPTFLSDYGLNGSGQVHARAHALDHYLFMDLITIYLWTKWRLWTKRQRPGTCTRARS